MGDITAKRRGMLLKMQRINKLLGRPATPSSTTADGKYQSNDGHLFIDHYQPGGNRHTYVIAEMVGTGGCESHPLGYRRLTADELNAQLDGIEYGILQLQRIASQAVKK